MRLLVENWLKNLIKIKIEFIIWEKIFEISEDMKNTIFIILRIT